MVRKVVHIDLKQHKITFQVKSLQVLIITTIHSLQIENQRIEKEV